MTDAELLVNAERSSAAEAATVLLKALGWSSGGLGAAAAEIVSQRDKLQRFKDYVHKRLDDAGVAVDPESSHKAEGCRIGGRLDEVFAERDAMRAELCRLLAWFDRESDLVGETGTGSTQGELIDEAIRLKGFIGKPKPTQQGGGP